VRYILFFLLVVASLNAKYFNTNILISKGVDPQVLNLSVTIFKQDVYFEIDVKDDKHIDNTLSSQNFRVLYNPYKKYGIDIGVEIPKKDINKYNTSDIKYELDFIMGLQSYLQSEKLYDEKTIKDMGKVDGFDVVEFEFNKDDIPRELSIYKHLKGRVYIKEGVLKKIILRNTDSFEYKGVEIKHYKKILNFSQPKDGYGYLIKSMSIKIDGQKDSKRYDSNVFGVFSNYKDKNENAIELIDGYEKNVVKNQEYEKINVNLERILPFFGQDVRRMGYDLPKPFGVSLVNMYQQTRFYMQKIEVDGHENISKVFKDTSKYENSTYASLIKADVWLLPFLDLSVLVGGTSTSTDVTLDFCLLPNKGCPSGGYPIDFSINTTSVLYGVGATLGGGVGDFFGSVDFQYILSYTASNDVKTQISIITPVFGYYFHSIGLRVYGGGMYEDLKEDVDFKARLENGKDITGTIYLKAQKWAGTLGCQYAFTRHWEANILGAYGEDFQNMSLVLTYRW